MLWFLSWYAVLVYGFGSFGFVGDCLGLLNLAGCWSLMVVWRILIWYCRTGLWFVDVEVWWYSCLLFVLMLILVSGGVLVMLALLVVWFVWFRRV